MKLGVKISDAGKSSLTLCEIFGEKMQLFTVEASDPACWAVGPLETQGTYGTLSGCLKCRNSLQPAGRGFVPLASSWDFFWTQTRVSIVPEFERGLKPLDVWSPSPLYPLGCWLDFFLKKKRGLALVLSTVKKCIETDHCHELYTAACLWLQAPSSE